MIGPERCCKAEEGISKDAWPAPTSSTWIESADVQETTTLVHLFYQHYVAVEADILFAPTGEKLWLGTHVWHAKRMHMIDIWGYRLVSSASPARPLRSPVLIRLESYQAEKPTEKAYRSSYRAAFHGAMVHDASYHQYFQLDGPEDQLRTLLDKMCDPATISPTSKR